MKRFFGLLVVALFAAALAAGCGGDEKKAGPAYPACKADGDCSSHGEFCFNGTCSECAKDKNCSSKGACMGCDNGKCAAKKNCCTEKADCPDGMKCVVKPGKKEGICDNL